MNSSNILNPVVVYSTIWIGVLIFIKAGWANMMSPPKPKFMLLVAGNILVALLAYQVARLFTTLRARLAQTRGMSRTRLRGAISPATQAALLRYSDFVFAAWLTGSAINVYCSGGIPILWLLRGDSRTYADFGVLTLSGLASACGLFATLGYVLVQFAGGTKRRWWAVVLIFLYQVAIINRGLIVWMLIEVLGLYVQVGRLGFRRIMQGAAILAFLVVIFGEIGEVRVHRGRDFMLKMTATEDGYSLFRHLPSGAWWTYLYSSVGAVNLNLSVDDVEPLGYPYWSVINLVPSVFRLGLYHVMETSYEARYPLKMVNEGSNVFTMYGGYLADFGMAGCFAITFVLHLLAGYYFIRARSGDVPSIIAYAVCLQVMVVSLFSDSLTTWMTLFQLSLAFAFRHFLSARFRSRAVAARTATRKLRPPTIAITQMRGSIADEQILLS